MGVKLVSASAGSVEIVAPATASNYTATMPAGSGTVAVNGVSGTLVSGTAVASTSGTSISFTDIPSWVKRITVMFNGVSTSGSSVMQIQIGSGSYTTSGYASQAANATTNSGVITSGFVVQQSNAAGSRFSGVASVVLLGSNLWVCSGILSYVDGSATGNISSGNSPTLGGTLDRIRVTTINGTDTFDAGSINILYE